MIAVPSRAWLWCTVVRSFFLEIEDDSSAYSQVEPDTGEVDSEKKTQRSERGRCRRSQVSGFQASRLFCRWSQTPRKRPLKWWPITALTCNRRRKRTLYIHTELQPTTHSTSENSTAPGTSARPPVSNTRLRVSDPINIYSFTFLIRPHCWFLCRVAGKAVHAVCTALVVPGPKFSGWAQFSALQGIQSSLSML